MLPDELAAKVKRIEITTRKWVEDALSGQYRSQFKGLGVQFSEHRQYLAGDDVRHIDWKASARTKEPLLKKYEEERERTVFLVIDNSSSSHFGTAQKTKKEMLAEIGGMLTYAASFTGDKVGLILFSGQVDRILPPKKGRQHVLRMIREILEPPPPSPGGSNLTLALESTLRILKHSGVVFILSDFIAENYETVLKRVGKKHDAVALWIQDQREFEVPKLGYFKAQDPETGQETWVDTGSYAFQNWLKTEIQSFKDKTAQTFRSAQVDVHAVKTQEDYAESVVRYFQKRARRLAR